MKTSTGRRSLMGRLPHGFIAPSFSKRVLGLSTTYATAEINADYAYYNALVNSHASELQTALANKQTPDFETALTCRKILLCRMIRFNRATVCVKIVDRLGQGLPSKESFP